MTIEALATLMNSTVADTTAFIAGISVWTNKGLSIEEAIVRHMDQMTRFVNNAVTLANDETFRQVAIDAFYP